MDYLNDEVIHNCIICQKKDTKKNRCAKKSEASTLLRRCEELVENGDTKVTDFLERLNHAKNIVLLDKVRDHSECRKLIIP